MLVSELKNRARNSLGAASSEIDGFLDDAIEDTLQQIHRFNDWVWDEDDTTVTVLGSIAMTGTWSKGDSALVVSTGDPGADRASYVGGLMKLTNNIYEIETYPDSTNITIPSSARILEEDAASPAAFNIIQDVISLPANVESVNQVVSTVSPMMELWATDENRRNRYSPDPFLHLGTLPRQYWTYGADASGNVQMGIFPPTDVDLNLRIMFRRKTTLPSSDSDDLLVLTGIPEKFHDVIVEGVKHKCYEFEFENQATTGSAYAKFREGLAEMRAFSDSNAGRLHVLGRDWSGSHGLGDHRMSGMLYYDRGKITGV